MHKLIEFWMAWRLKNVEMSIWVAEKCLYLCVCMRVCIDTDYVCMYLKISWRIWIWHDFINAGYSEICFFPFVWIIKAWSYFIKKRCGVRITCRHLGPCCFGVRKLLFRWQKSTGWGMRKEPAIRGVKWDVGSPRSVRPVSPTKYECCTLSPPPSGGMTGGWPGWSGVVPPGRITRRHLWNHFPDNYSHFIWEACPGWQPGRWGRWWGQERWRSISSWISVCG